MLSLKKMSKFIYSCNDELRELGVSSSSPKPYLTGTSGQKRS
jgi:hypothetical protein